MPFSRRVAEQCYSTSLMVILCRLMQQLQCVKTFFTLLYKDLGLLFLFKVKK